MRIGRTPWHNHLWLVASLSSAPRDPVTKPGFSQAPLELTLTLPSGHPPVDPTLLLSALLKLRNDSLADPLPGYAAFAKSAAVSNTTDPLVWRLNATDDSQV